MGITTSRLWRLVLVDLAAFIAGAAAYASDGGHLPARVAPVALGVILAGNLGTLLVGRRGRARRRRRERKERSESDGGYLWSAIGWTVVHMLFFALVIVAPFLASTYGSHANNGQRNTTPGDRVANASPAILSAHAIPLCPSQAITAAFEVTPPKATWLTVELTNAAPKPCRLGASETVVAVGRAGSLVAKLTQAQPSDFIGPVLNPGDQADAWVTGACSPAAGGAPGFRALRIMWAGGSTMVTLPHGNFLTTAVSNCALTVSPFAWSTGG